MCACFKSNSGVVCCVICVCVKVILELQCFVIAGQYMCRVYFSILLPGGGGNR